MGGLNGVIFHISTGPSQQWWRTMHTI